MWGSKEKRRKAQFERALADMPEAAEHVAGKWEYYSSTMVFKDHVPLSEQIRLFSIPLAQFFSVKFPDIYRTDPGVYFSTLLMGIYLSKTIPIPELLTAARDIESETRVEGIQEMLSRFIKSTPNL